MSSAPGTPTLSPVLSALVPAVQADEVARALATPPPGLLAPGDVAGPEARQVLALAVLSAARASLSSLLPVCLDWLRSRLARLDADDQGRVWHLRGVLASRQGDLLRATVALNRALRLASERYRPRVHDSFGRLLQAQGLVEEARTEYRLALAAREAHGDDAGTALTLGNLARLELENGNWLAAREAFQRDHDLVLRVSPEDLRLRAQLLVHLGECERGLGNAKQALGYFERAGEAARQAGDDFGLAVALAEQARALVPLRPAEAGPRLAQAKALAEQLGAPSLVATGAPGGVDASSGAGVASRPEPSAPPEAPPTDTPGPSPTMPRAASRAGPLRSLLALAEAEVAASERRTLDAEVAFVRALDEAERSATVSPVQHALIARAAARFQAEAFSGGRSVEYLQRALRLLDATSATALRAEVEGELKRASTDAWTLHVVSRFMGRGAVELALREAGQAGFRGQRTELAVLFADLRGFTTAAEHLSPPELVDSLNQFLSRMAGCVEASGGEVDKFVGDAVMALFGADGDVKAAARDSVRAALLMQAELERLNRGAGRLGQLTMGVGVHFGPSVLGLIGSPQHRSYTALGGTVNLASRMEGMTKQLGASVLVSGELVAHLDAPAFVLRPLGLYAPKGAATPLRCFDVMGEGDDLLPLALIDELAASSEAADAAERGDFSRAATALRRALDLSEGTHRQVGYRLRLTACEGGEAVVRLSEK